MKKLTFLMIIVFCSNVSAKKDSVNLNYMRSSLATFFVDNGKLEQDGIVKSAFLDKFAPDKYNAHELENRIIPNPSAVKNDDLINYLENYFQTNQIAKNLVAKWFNRSEKGGFNVDLVMKRGLYNAQELDKQIAKNTISGLSGISDKGEDLINNTFVVVMASNYTNKANVASNLNIGLSFLQNYGLLQGGLGMELAKSTITTVGKGYWVGTKSYLFKLVWDEETKHRFYNELWDDDEKITPEKKAAFDTADFFKLEYVGETSTGADIQSSTFSQKSEAQLIERATIKSFDKSISNLQQEYEVFSLKIPIYSAEPIITIKAGSKEGISEKSKFGVFEMQQGKNGALELVQVGKMKVDKEYPIWNNEFGADEENSDKNVDCTVLKVQSMKGEIVPGMLVMQTK